MIIDIDYIGTKKDAIFDSEQYGIEITLVECDQAIALIKGTKDKLKSFLVQHHYGDEQEVNEIYFQ